MRSHDARDLIHVFNALFADEENTVLIGGGEEPVYWPADEKHPSARIIFTRDYFASALHEIAHWCIAGDERRGQVDYGYWYEPDGRDPALQTLFEWVEVAPQALECLFSETCGSPFRPSFDNLDGDHFPAQGFAARIQARVRQYREQGVPSRAARFLQALADFYGTANPAPSTLSVPSVSAA